MEVKVIHRGARISAQKMRLVADQIRARGGQGAQNVLDVLAEEGGGYRQEGRLSAIANAEHNEAPTSTNSR